MATGPRAVAIRLKRNYSAPRLPSRLRERKCGINIIANGGFQLMSGPNEFAGVDDHVAMGREPASALQGTLPYCCGQRQQVRIDAIRRVRLEGMGA